MLKVIFYHYYLFYSSVLKEDSPIVTAVFTVCLSISFFINGVLNVSLAYFYNFALSTWNMIFVFLGIFALGIINYFVLGKAKKIVRSKPLFITPTLSVLLTILFFLITSSCLILDPMITREILNN